MIQLLKYLLGEEKVMMNQLVNYQLGKKQLVKVYNMEQPVLRIFLKHTAIYFRANKSAVPLLVIHICTGTSDTVIL